MKKLLILLVLFYSLTLHARTIPDLYATKVIADTTVIDSSAQKVSFNLRVSDVCYLTTVINLQSKDIERQYDSLKKAFRNPVILAQLTDSTILHIDSVAISALLRVSLRLRATERFFTAGVFERFHAALRATGNAYLIAKLNELDADDQIRVKDIMNRGKNQLMGLN